MLMVLNTLHINICEVHGTCCLMGTEEMDAKGIVFVWICCEFSFFGILCGNLPRSLLSSFIMCVN